VTENGESGRRPKRVVWGVWGGDLNVDVIGFRPSSITSILASCPGINLVRAT